MSLSVIRGGARTGSRRRPRPPSRPPLRPVLLRVLRMFRVGPPAATCSSTVIDVAFARPFPSPPFAARSRSADGFSAVARPPLPAPEPLPPPPRRREPATLVEASGVASSRCVAAVSLMSASSSAPASRVSAMAAPPAPPDRPRRPRPPRRRRLRGPVGVPPSPLVSVAVARSVASLPVASTSASRRAAAVVVVGRSASGDTSAESAGSAASPDAAGRCPPPPRPRPPRRRRAPLFGAAGLPESASLPSREAGSASPGRGITFVERVGDSRGAVTSAVMGVGAAAVGSVPAVRRGARVAVVAVGLSWAVFAAVFGADFGADFGIGAPRLNAARRSSASVV